MHLIHILAGVINLQVVKSLTIDPLKWSGPSAGPISSLHKCRRGYLFKCSPACTGRPHLHSTDSTVCIAPF